MVTARTSAPGADRASRSLAAVATRLEAIGKRSRELTQPLFSGGIAALLLGGGFLALAVNSGIAGNALTRFQSALDEAIAPVWNLLDAFVGLFERMPLWAQRLVVFGLLFLVVGGYIAGLAARAIPFLIAAFGRLGGVLGALRGAFLATWAVALGPVGLIVIGILGIAAALYFAATRSETFRQGFEDATNWMINRANDLLGILYTIGDVTTGIGAAIGAIASGRNPITAFQDAQTGGLRDTGFRIPAYDIPGNRSGFHQGDGILTPAERALLDRITGSVGGGFGFLGGAPGAAPAPGAGGPVINYYGASAQQLEDFYRTYGVDPATQQLLNGGP